MLDTQVLADSPARHANGLPTSFACSWTRNGRYAAWVSVAGELDIATSPHLERTLREAQRQAGLVVTDLRRVSFADSSAIHALVAASRRAQRGSCRLVILRGPPQVDRMFTLSRACEVLQVVDVDAGAPPVMALLRLAAEEREMRASEVGHRFRRTG